MHTHRLSQINGLEHPTELLGLIDFGGSTRLIKHLKYEVAATVVRAMIFGYAHGLATEEPVLLGNRASAVGTALDRNCTAYVT